jgi:hypothetical protein
LSLSERLSPKEKRLLRLLILALAGIVPNRVVANKVAKLRLMARPDGRGAEIFMEGRANIAIQMMPIPKRCK